MPFFGCFQPKQITAALEWPSFGKLSAAGLSSNGLEDGIGSIWHREER